MMKYKGYTGVVVVDQEAGVLRGKVVDLKDTITFQGKTVPETMTAFQESVDDYLEFCASLGERPEKPFSGKILVRLKPDIHRDLSTVAQIRGTSVNRLVLQAIESVASAAHPPAAEKAASSPRLTNVPEAGGGTKRRKPAGSTRRTAAASKKK